MYRRERSSLLKNIFNQIRMVYNPKYHHRKSIRLKGYDYTQAGLYFITICCQKRACLFGEVKNGIMILNDSGEMIKKWYYELENKFQDIKCHEMIIMPNHFHCIIENTSPIGITPGINIGADLRVCPDTAPVVNTGIITESGKKSKLIKCKSDEHGSTLNEHGSTSNEDVSVLGEQHIPILGEHIGSLLSRVLQWFKTMTTNEYIRNVKTNGWTRFDKKLCQRNYWEHIIRNEKSYQNISTYIKNNPLKWDSDKLT